MKLVRFLMPDGSNASAIMGAIEVISAQPTEEKKVRMVNLANRFIEFNMSSVSRMQILDSLFK